LPVSIVRKDKDSGVTPDRIWNSLRRLCQFVARLGGLGRIRTCDRGLSRTPLYPLSYEPGVVSRHRLTTSFSNRCVTSHSTHRRESRGPLGFGRDKQHENIVNPDHWRNWYSHRRWLRLRRMQLRSHPLCVICEKQGRLTPATVADHIEPHRGSLYLFWYGALQSLCKQCHDRKTRSPGFSADIGEDGWPVDPKHTVYTRVCGRGDGRGVHHRN
jgi:HNH endonuclease